MRCPGISEDEIGRLRALAEYDLSAKRGLPSLDPIVEMAAKMFDCPAAAVNMIGSDHVYLVSRTGIDDYDARRDVSFCAHAINQSGVMVIDDASLDRRFYDNPLVANGAIRFYAGVPLLSPSGHALGALCVIDSKARGQFTEEDQERLKELAGLVVDRLELRRLEVAAGRGSKLLEASAATSPNAIITFDANACITAWNKGATDMFERTEDEALGKPVDLLVAETDRMQVRACIARVLAGGAPGGDGTELAAVRSTGTVFPVEIHWSRWEGRGRRISARSCAI
jgi:PAS domain S-box-containing protein